MRRHAHGILLQNTGKSDRDRTLFGAGAGLFAQDARRSPADEGGGETMSISGGLTRENGPPPERPAPPGMVWIAGGTFLMGSDRHYPEERPAHKVAVGDFWMDRHLVTNAQFRRFVAATGHITIAEVAPDPRDYPAARPQVLHPSSMVFVKPAGPVDMEDIGNWWQFMRGADWRHPQGPGSSLDGLDDHPVVHVAYRDAQAYAAWTDKAIPSEAEWEFAARGGLEGMEFPWGDEPMPGGRPMANFWHGQFPWQNLGADGYESISLVGVFAPNGYGLFDMVGNVWEWTP